MIRKVSRAELEEIAREGYRREFPAEPRRAPRTRNVLPTLLLIDGERLEIPFRGRVYELRPVTFEDGIRLSAAQADIDECASGELTGREGVRRYAAALRLVVRMAPRYLLPRGRLRRVFWRLRLRRNPFRSATAAEVGELLGFFLGYRTRSRVRYPAT